LTVACVRSILDAEIAILERGIAEHALRCVRPSA
jgi:hypothetical protein